VLCNQRLELLHHVGVLAERQLCLDQLLEGRDPGIVEACHFGLGEGLIGEIRQRRAAPQRERVLELRHGRSHVAVSQFHTGLGDQPFEAMRVEPLRIERELVAALAGYDRAGRAAPVVTAQRLTKPRDMHLQRLGRASRRILAPQLVDQAVGRERLVEVDQQQRQQSARLASRKREPAVTVEDLERAEDAEVHG
jgi:hypothetical protein